MAAAYFESGINPTATFELFVRRLPEHRSFLLAAGLEQAIDYIENLSFESSEVDFLRNHPAFRSVSPQFFAHLASLRFTGDVWAVREGTPIFAQEPLLRVTAPIIEAQVVETYLLTAITFPSTIASKAVRMVSAAGNRGVVEFGSRRAHGPEAGVLAARAAYIGGCVGTSNVEAGFRFGIPTYGTLAHSFVMAFGDELESFRQMERIFPEHSVLLIDTYDTLAATDGIISAGLRPKGVRLDSGDLLELSKEVRRRLDAAGLTQTIIFASGDLSEYSISELLARGAPINMFGVGTELATSKDEPALSGVYKLVELSHDSDRSYAIKLSAGKPTYPGAKQVYRFQRDGMYERDLIACAGELLPPGGEPLLECVMRQGKRLATGPSLSVIRAHAAETVSRLPRQLRSIDVVGTYPVDISAGLERLQTVERQKHTPA